MTETDPDRLADAHEREVDELQERSDRLAAQASETRADWEQKRADQGVPGAAPHEKSPAGDDGDAAASPDAGSPPPGAGPAQADGGAGPPADVIDETHDED